MFGNGRRSDYPRGFNQDAQITGSLFSSYSDFKPFKMSSSRLLFGSTKLLRLVMSAVMNPRGIRRGRLYQVASFADWSYCLLHCTPRCLPCVSSCTLYGSYFQSTMFGNGRRAGCQRKFNECGLSNVASFFLPLLFSRSANSTWTLLRVGKGTVALMPSCPLRFSLVFFSYGAVDQASTICVQFRVVFERNSTRTRVCVCRAASRPTDE